MFIPLGFLIPAIWEKTRSFCMFILTASIILIAIETIQLFTLLGSMDIDDFILNIIGTIIGYLIFVVLFDSGKIFLVSFYIARTEKEY